MVLKKLIYFIILFVSLGLIYNRFQNKPGKIIVLDGIPSKEKAILVKQLAIDCPGYKILSFTDYFSAQVELKARELGWKGQAEVSAWSYLNKTMGYLLDTELSQKLFDNSDLYKKALQESSTGKNVIIDLILENEQEVENFNKIFSRKKVIKILFYKQLDFSSDLRNIEQFYRLFKIHSNETEKIVDIISSKSFIQLFDDISNKFLKNFPDEILEQYKFKIYELQRKFIKSLDLNVYQNLVLTSVDRYDLVLNYDNNSTDLAKLLCQYLKSL